MTKINHLEATKPRVILFGGNRKNEDGPLLVVALSLVKKYDVLVITDYFRLNLSTKNGFTFQERLQQEKIKWLVFDTINTSSLHNYVHDKTIGLSLGAMWIFKNDVINLFRGHLYNYHNTRLPTERGASAYTWKILSQNKDGGLTIHKIEEDLDVGDILQQEKFFFPKRCQIQSDYYQFISKKETSFILKFISYVLNNKKFKPIKQSEEKSTYWPKLDTVLHGYINWEWSAKEIVIFIKAFDDPHLGALTFIDGIKVHLKKCILDEKENKFHPFQSGLVFRIYNENLYVSAKKGSLIIQDVIDEQGNKITSTIKLGHRFYTPFHLIESAKISRSSYQDEVKKIKPR